MAWSFKRRIKIAPGVNINFSKSGIGTSIGPKGAKVSFGPKGTYLHTGIPGTGIYNRQKVGDAPSSSNPPMNTPSSSGNNGCLYVFMWCLLLISLAMTAGCIYNINETRKEISSVVAQNYSMISGGIIVDSLVREDGNRSSLEDEERPESVDNLTIDRDLSAKVNKHKNYLRAFYLFIALALLSGLWLINYSSKKRQISSSLKSKPSKSIMDGSTQNTIDKIKQSISKTSNPLKKKVLNNYLGYIIREDAENRLKPLVDKWQKKVEHNPIPKTEEQLSVYQEQYKSAIEESEKLIIRIDEELSEQEKKNYLEFCNAFQELKRCKGHWIIMMTRQNDDLKSSARTTVSRAQVVFKNECFPYLESQYSIPVLPSTSIGSIYFYPRFVIYGSSLDMFEVYPMDRVSLTYKQSRFIEDGFWPSDAIRVGTTYKYVNKSGEPDRRFANNPQMPILLYGDIVIKPFNETIEVSNCESARLFELAYQMYRDTALQSGAYVSTDSPSTSSQHDAAKDLDDSEALSPELKLLKDVAHYVVLSQHASVADVQRKFGLGYAKTGGLFDQLETLCIIGPQNGAKPREVLVQNLDEIDTIIGRILNPSAYPNDISEQYFNDLLDAAKRLLQFGDKLAKNVGFCKVVGETVSGNVNWNDKLLTEPKEKIPIYLWADVIRCYSGLGHGFNLSSNEGLGLLMFNSLMAQPDFVMEYRFLDLLRKRLVESSESFTRKAASTMRGNEEVIILEECLKDYNKQLHNQYIVLLYRFASLVAKADKQITSTEAEWLNKIMALKEPDGEDDVIQPIEPVETTSNKTTKRTIRSRAAKELNSLIGLASVKSEINTLTNYIKVQNMRAEKGMKVTPVSYHCVFTGNPGTGKTTVARIVSEIYRELGILKKGHLVETDRSGLVAEYVGQTAVKTNKIIDSALDGILFIDEAYSLVDGGNSDYGKEAISTLLKRMEDERDRLVVILAGYTNDMKRFIESNPGLQSRFNRYIEFPDYTAEELFQIFELNTKKYEYKMTEAAAERLKDALAKAVEVKDKYFGNGRFVRNLFEKVVENQANRVSSEVDITAESLATIELEDIEKSL